MPRETIGGGAKKILYTLDTVRRIGPARSLKALNARNTCKACGLGMGGQRGGMTNEVGEFPAVCNKSVQAQSTDIQPAVPEEIFAHDLAAFRELSARQMEHLGRLATPIRKAPGDGRYTPIGWDEALDRAAARLADTDPARAFFYSSGRSSNEAGFLFQLLARLYGTNNVNNCSYYCHQATGVALGATIGTGTSTVELADLAGADLIFVVGANPASNHPRFIHQLTKCRERGGHVIVVNPAREPGLVRFAVPKSAKSMLSGGSEIASLYLQPMVGEDIALFKGLAKALLAAGAVDDAFIAAHTEGFDAFRRDVERTSWEEIVGRCAVDRAAIEQAAALYARSRAAVFAWGMGMTHHRHGVENIEVLTALALMRGMVGRRHAGLLPLRGHSNVQGIGTIGVKPVLADEVVARIEAAFGITLPQARGMDTMACMHAAHRGEIDAAVIMGGNLYAANPRSGWAAEALDRIGFKLFLTTTLNAGHVNGVDRGESIVLPVTARDEEWEPTTQESMFNFVRLSDGGIARLDGVRPESRILADIGLRMLPDCPIDLAAFAGHRRIREAIAETVPGMEDLADIDVARREFHIRNRLMHEPVFRTPGGKARFVTHPLPPAEASTEAGSPRFRLTTVRSEGQFNSIIYEETDAYRGGADRWSLFMNREDMAAHGLAPGDRVTVASATGAMRGVVLVPFDLPRGAVMAYYPEANRLTACDVDPRSRTPGFKSVAVTVTADGTAGTG